MQLVVHFKNKVPNSNLVGHPRNKYVFNVRDLLTQYVISLDQIRKNYL